MQYTVVFKPAIANSPPSSFVTATPPLLSDFPPNFDFALCSMTHHKTWEFFFMFCRPSATTLQALYRFDYTLSFETNTATINGYTVKLQRELIGYIQQISMTSNANQTYSIKQLYIIFVSTIDLNYNESIIKICRIIQDTNNSMLFSLLDLDARTLNLRTISVLDASVISIPSSSAESSQGAGPVTSTEELLLALVSSSEVIFLIVQAGGISPSLKMRAFLQGSNHTWDG